MSRNIQTLLGDIPKTKFVDEYFHRLPFSLTGGARSLCELGTWDLLGEVLRQQDVDVMVVRDGQRYEAPDPTDLETARQLSAEGYTILIRHAEKRNEHLRNLAAAFEEDFHAPVNIHIDATPPGKHGFSWHYDAEDVFIIRALSTKRNNQ